MVDLTDLSDPSRVSPALLLVGSANRPSTVSSSWIDPLTGSAVPSLHLLRKQDQLAGMYAAATNEDGTSRNEAKRIKLHNGFRCIFEFATSRCTQFDRAPCGEGFALVIHRNQEETPLGVGGPSLGYGQQLQAHIC